VRRIPETSTVINHRDFQGGRDLNKFCLVVFASFVIARNIKLMPFSFFGFLTRISVDFLFKWSFDGSGSFDILFACIAVCFIVLSCPNDFWVSSDGFQLTILLLSVFLVSVPDMFRFLIPSLCNGISFNKRP
jgi:hypothetical protein